jgi:hypothetical protein
VVNVPTSSAAIRDAYTERCDQCRENLTQRRDDCPNCGRPVRWEGSRIAKNRAKRRAAQEADKKANETRQKIEQHYSPTVAHILSIARATALSGQVTYAKGEAQSLFAYEQAYGAELLRAKANEFKAAGNKGRGLIKHLLTYLEQHNPSGKPGKKITTNADELMRQDAEFASQ